MERWLDKYLINLDDYNLNKYNLDKDMLYRDINNRKVSTFLSRKDNIKAFNSNKGNKILNLRYSIAQIYTSKFLKLDDNLKKEHIKNLIENIEDNNIIECRKSFGMDLNNKLKLTFEIEDMAKNINNVLYDLYPNEFEKEEGKNIKINQEKEMIRKKEIIKEDNIEDREI